MKKSKLWKIILVVIFIVFQSALVSAGVLPLGQAEYDFVYDRLEHIDAASPDLYDYQIGPYNLDHESFSFGPFDSYRRVSPGSLLLFSFLTEDYRTQKQARAAGYESFRGGIVGRPLKKVFVFGSFILDEERAKDPSYIGKKWRGLAGDVEEAFVNFHTDKFDLTAGRFGSFWGLRNSLILSHRQPLDGFGYTYRWGRLSISYRLARLDGLNPTRDTVTQFENRYFAGHRFDFHFSNRLRVGAFETVVFGGPGRQIELAYLNPLIFFHGSQLNEGVNDNTIIGFDFSAKPFDRIKLYGQLLVDDFQIDNKTQSDQEPNEIGYLLGGYLADLMPSIDLTAEYTRVNNWTFNQPLERNRYLFNDQPIGGALGNDYDLARASVVKWLGDEMALTANAAYLRQGEGSITAEWTAPWLATSGSYSESFPSGTVEKTTTLSTGFKGFLFDHFFVSAHTGLRHVVNYANTDGDNRTLPFFSLMFSGFVSGPVGLE